MTSSVFRSIALIFLAVLFLYYMQRFGFLRWAEIVSAFVAHPKTIVGVCAVQVAMAVVMMFRYWRLLGVFGVQTELRHASSATFVSTALGQWFPGSLAVTEVLRVSLMFGSDFAQQSKDTPKQFEVKSRLAIVSLVDRLVGFLGILLMGALFSGYSLVKMLDAQGAEFEGVAALFVLSSSGVLVLVSLPFLVRARLIRKWTRSPKQCHSGQKSVLFRWYFLLFQRLEVFRHDIEAGTRHPSRLVLPVLISILSLLLAATTLYLSARALSVRLDFLQIICVFPVISVAALLPLGFAGIGGYQLVMASVFGIFSVPPAAVASAGVLQSALSLLMCTLLGLLFWKVSSRQVRAIFRNA